MRQFDAAPAIPSTYVRLRSLTAEEVAQARAAGYVADLADLAKLICRSGLDNLADDPPPEDTADWRVRIYLIWICYIYENLKIIRNPLGAIDELILEFHGSEILDRPGFRIASLYAGAWTPDSLPESDLQKQLEILRPSYEKAIHLLDAAPASSC
jgi:hypothetical protein